MTIKLQLFNQSACLIRRLTKLKATSNAKLSLLRIKWKRCSFLDSKKVKSGMVGFLFYLLFVQHSKWILLFCIELAVAEVMELKVQAQVASNPQGQQQAVRA